jgi:hypothetical protein
MRFSTRDQILGAFLTPIVEHGAHIERLGDHRGHFQINQTVNTLVKYSRPEPSSPRSDTLTWSFYFRSKEKEILHEDIGRASLIGKALLGLICVPDCICLLESGEWRRLIEPTKDGGRNIYVERSPECQMRVSVRQDPGSEITIPQSRFPDLLFSRGVPVHRQQ